MTLHWCMPQVGIAVIHHRRGEFEDARAAYQNALKLDADAHYALNGLARLYLESAVSRGNRVTQSLPTGEKSG